jgi:hypothetical protein
MHRFPVSLCRFSRHSLIETYSKSSPSQMADSSNDPQFITLAREAAIVAGLDPEVANTALDFAAFAYQERYNGPHKVMTEALLAEHGVLYKYRDAMDEHHWSILEKKELWFANPSTFNDPFDSNIQMRYDLLPAEDLEIMIKNAAKVIHPHGGCFLIQGEMGRIKEAIMDPTRHDAAMRQWMEWARKMRVFCVCPEKNNILLWSHYSFNHTGFAIGFDPMQLYSLCGANGGFQTGHVAYRENYPVLLPPRENDDDAKREIITNVMNVKSRIWSYEKEIRFTMVDGPQKVSFSVDLIKEIVIGCKMVLKNQDRLLRIANESYPHAAIYRAHLNREKFALDFNKLT